MKHPNMNLRCGVALLLAGGALLSAGCQNQLVFTTATKFGLDISQQANQSPHVVFGYDRAELAFIPVPKGTNNLDAGATNDAYSVLGAFSLKFNHDIRSNTGDGLTMHQILATGNAARQAAGDPGFGALIGDRVRDLQK